MPVQGKQKMFFTAILLAAGRSQRMGSQNKLLLPLSGKPLILHMLDCLESSAVDDIIVVTGHEKEVIKNILPADITTVHNPDHLQGMTTTIQKGVEAARPDSAGYLICLSDTPFIQAQDVNQVIDAFTKAQNQIKQPIIIPEYEQIPGHPKLFSSGYREEIRKHTETEGLKKLIQSHTDSVVKVRMSSDRIIRDIDTPEIYEKYTLSLRR